jgi:hypothetical protein
MEGLEKAKRFPAEEDCFLLSWNADDEESSFSFPCIN